MYSRAQQLRTLRTSTQRMNIPVPALLYSTVHYIRLEQSAQLEQAVNKVSSN